MIDELDRRLQQLSREQAESAPVPVDWESVGDRAFVVRPTPDRPSRRVLAVAGGVAVVSALVVGLVVLGDGRETDPMGGSIPAVESAPVIGEVVTVPPTLLPTSSTTEAVATTTPAVVDTLTLDDVREGQVAALRRLPGFTATAEVTQISTPFSLVDMAPMPEQTSVRTAEITLLPDGSFWSQTSPDEWGSYDPATHTVRGTFRGPDGVLMYQEMLGQADNSVPLGVMSGMFPTQLVGGMVGDSTRVEDTTFEGRPVWEITSTMVYDPSICQGDGCEADPFTQTMVQTIDQQTGLMIRSSNTTTEEHGTSQVAVLRDIRPVDTMPAGFPGAFPVDAVVERSGDPAAVSALTVADLPAHFGIPTPIPAGLAAAAVTATEMNGPSVDANDPAAPSYRTRSAEMVAHEGFLPTRVILRATVAAEGVTDDTVIDGYVCRSGDADQDGTCDAAVNPFGGGAAGSRSVTIERGALAGRNATVANGNLSVGFSIFDVYIAAPTDADAIAIANTFELP